MSRIFKPKNDSKTLETNRFSCAVTCLTVHDCAFRTFPFIKSDLLLSDPNNGDGVICSGRAFTGYQLLLEVETTEDNDVSRTTHSASVNFSILQGLIPINTSTKKEMSKLKGKRITQISIKDLKGFGYAPPSISRDPAQIQKAIEELRVHFLSNSSNAQRHFHVDPDTDIRAFSSLPRREPSLLAPLMRIDLPSVDLTREPEDPITLSYALGEEIESQCRDVLGPLGDLKISDMLDATCAAFANAFDTFSSYSAPPSLTAVIGKTGAGKTLLVGYLSQKPLEWTEVDGANVMDFVSSAKSKGLEVGHGASQTKGGRIFERYIDTAGLFDTQGETADICNSAAVNMLIKSFNTDRIIFVVSKSFFDNRCTPLIALIKQIRRIISNPTRPEILSSLLFLVNEKRSNADAVIDSEGILKALYVALAQAKKNLVAERERLLPKGSLGGWLFDTLTFNMRESARINKAIERLPKGQRDKIIQLGDEIEILEMIERHAKFMVADFSSDTTRTEIQEWQRQAMSGALAESFTLDQLVPNGFYKFRTMVLGFVTHFNRKVIKLVDLNKKLSDLESSFKDKAGEKANLEQRNDASALTDNKRAREIERERLKKEEASLVKEVSDLQALIKSLQSDDTKTRLLTLQPDTPIVPRSFWGWGGLAYYYTFSYDAKVPIVKVKRSKSPGTWETAAAKTNLDKGKYTVWYTPKWYGHQQDCTAKVAIYVANKDAPATIALKQQKEAELTTKQGDLVIKKREVLSCRDKIDSYNVDITKGLRDNKKRVATLTREIEEAQGEMKVLASQRNELLQELHRYKMMTTLVSKIIIGLRMNQNASGSEQQMLTTFLRDFTEEGLWKTFAAGIPRREQRPVRTFAAREFGLEPTVGHYTGGNCLFDAIQLLIGSRSSIELRAMAVERIRNTADFDEAIQAGAEGQEKLRVFNVNVNDFEDVVYTNKDEYCANMELDQTWGTAIEVHSLAKALNRPIVIFQDGRPQLYGGETGEPIFLEFDGNHYRPLIVDGGRPSAEILQAVRKLIGSSAGKAATAAAAAGGGP